MQNGKSSPVKLRVLLAMCTALALFSTTSAYAVTYIKGIDVYSGDGAVTWSTVKNGGYDFAFVKATEGVNFVDSRFATNMSGANAAGIYVGPYHFVRADSKDGVPFTSYDNQPFLPTSGNNINAWLDATSEADDFIDAIRPYYYQTGATKYLPPVADVEKYPNFGDATKNKNFISNWSQLFSDTVFNALGVRPIVYTSQSHANSNFTAAFAAQHKLWIAWWKGTGTTSPPLQSDTPNWSPWLFWQWTATGTVTGVPGSGANGDVDQDVLSGTSAQLAALRLQLLHGDYNHNSVVDGGDYVLWRKQVADPNYSIYASVNLGADGDSNDIVNTGDYAYWRSQFGKMLSGSGSGLDSSGVPEPCASWFILSAGFVLLFARSRQ
jgi:GH25 family lysozyme M1 (1,4-beta-N-acetylmuramidase)